MWVCNAATDTIYKFTIGPNSVVSSEPADFVVFPNPAIHEVFISGLDTRQVLEIRLFDLQGRFIKNFMPEKRMSLDAITEGMYVLRVRTNTGIISKTITVAGSGR